MKKIWVNYFFMKNMYIKFQIPSMHHSEVTDVCTHTPTHPPTHTDKPKAICPSNFFKVGGIKTQSQGVNCLPRNSCVRDCPCNHALLKNCLYMNNESDRDVKHVNDIYKIPPQELFIVQLLRLLKTSDITCKSSPLFYFHHVWSISVWP